MRQTIRARAKHSTVEITIDTAEDKLEIRGIGSQPMVFAGVEVTADGGGDPSIYTGRNFSVPASLDSFLAEEYPTVDRKREYLSADEWCNKKGFTPKIVSRFMVNWFKKASGGDSRRGGVIL